jgi:hypothetical protein
MGDDALYPGPASAGPSRIPQCSQSGISAALFASRKVLDVPDNIVRGTLGLVELAFDL